MDNNKTCHRTLAVQDCLDSEGIQRLVWQAHSPDLNPIENVWEALGRQVAGRNYPPTNKNTLIRALAEEWDKLPQQLLDNVVQSIAWQLYNAYTLYKIAVQFQGVEWQVPAAAFIFFLLFAGNSLTTAKIVHHKLNLKGLILRKLQ
ncbi:transmembrane protein 120 [Trichonephila clavipes]|nr:transmembrane protein 120 [Trichonephila clavipes]